MRFLVETSKLTGTPGASGWAQVHEFTPAEPEKEKLRGHLVAVVATENGQTEALVGREIISRLQEEYFGKLEGSIFNCLKNSVEKIRGEFASSLGEIEIIAAAVTENVVYVATGGGGSVAILREGMLASILEGKKETVAVASGYPKDGDVLLLGTSSFFSSVPPGIIKGALSSGSPEAAVEAFAPTILSKDQSGNIGLALIGFREERGFGNVLKETPVSQKIPHIQSFKVSSLFQEIMQKLPERKIYVQMPRIGGEEASDAKKRTFTVGIILLVLLLVSIGFGIKAKRDRESRGQYEAVLTEAEHKLSEAESLYSINPDQARELLADSRETVNRLIARKISDPQLTNLKAKLDEDEGRILGEYKEEPEVFIDLSLLSSGFNGNKLFSSGNKVFVLDKAGKKIVSVAYATKRSEVVAGPDDLGNVSDATAYGDKAFALNDSGIVEVTANNQKVVNKDWTGDVAIFAYTGNMYILDKGANTIWRYQGTPGQAVFGSKQKWLGPGVSPDFSQVISWSIDGSVWTLDSAADINRFTLGKQDAFTLAGVAPALSRPMAIYTNENLKSLYILDPDNRRVLVVGKDGKFIAQYISDKVKDAKGLAVSEENKKIILLLGNKLYSMEIKHL